MLSDVFKGLIIILTVSPLMEPQREMPEYGMSEENSGMSGMNN